MITDKQLDNFLATETEFDPSEAPIPRPPTGLSWIQPIGVRDKLDTNWTSDKVEQAKQSLNKNIGVGSLIPPTEVEQQKRLDIWWRDEGQFIPRHVLDQLGITGGDKVPTLQESIELERKEQVGVVKGFLGIEQPIGKDPLESLVQIPEVLDPKDIPPKPKPEIADIIRAASVDDLRVIKEAITNNPLEFEENLFQTVNDEIRIKETIPDVIEAIRDKPLITLIGTDFFNTLAGNLPEFTSRKGLSPTEALLGLPKGSESVWIRAVARVREQVVAQDPTLLTQIGAESGGIIADLIKFALIPDPSKARVFVGLSKTVKAAIGVGTKAGLVELLQAPEIGETFAERTQRVALATGIGALTGAILSKAIAFIEDIPVKLQATRLAQKFPQVSKVDWADILKVARQNRLIALRVEPPIAAARRIAPTGFRLGFAEIEKPAKIIGKAAAKTKEALVVEAAKALAVKAAKVAAVAPTKILTKAEALSLQQSNLITGEDVNIRVISDPKVARSIQASEKKIATLKTQIKQLKADKKVELAKTKTVEVAKTEEALAKLKETTGIKLEQTIEGSKAKIAKIREATEFKESLRNDAISMITAIPKEVRPAFINRANKVKTLNGLQKLTDEVEVGIERFERKIAIGELRSTIKDIESNNRLGKVRLGKIPSPQREKLIEIIDEISLKKISTQLKPPLEEVKTFGELDVKARKGREQLLGADLKSLQQITQRLSSELAGGLEGLNEDVEAALRLPDERVRQLNLLTQKNIAEIDTGDIRLIIQSLQQLVQNAKLKGKLLTKRGLKPLDGAIKTITEEEIAPTGKVIKIEKGKLEKTVEFGKKVLKLDDAHLDTLVQLSTNPGSTVMKQILDTDLHEGLRKTAEKLIGWIDASADQFEKIGFTDFDQITEKVKVTLGGKEIEVDKDFLVKLELHSRSPDNLRAILTTKGWSIEGVQIDYPEGIDRLAELKEALKIVRDDLVLKGIADWTNKLTPDRAIAIDEVFETLNGYQIARDPFYTSRPRALPRRVEGGKDISVPPEQQGQYLPRTGGTARLKLERWSDDFLSGLESDAALQMAIPLRNARILVSSDRFQTAMKAAGRELELNNMITILRRTQGVTTSRSTLEVFGGVLQRGVTVSALGFRVSTIGTQAMSFPAFFAEVNPVYGRPLVFIRGGYIAGMEEDSALLALRWKGRRVSVEVGTSAASEAFSTMLFDKSKKISNKALRGLVFGDKQAFGNGHKAIVREILSTVRNGKNVSVFEWDGETVADLESLTDDLSGVQSYPTSKKVRFAAARRIEFAGRKTQPAFDMLDRSVSLSNPNVLERQLFIFRTALEAQENIIIRATDAFAKSPKSATDKRALTADIASVMVSAFSVSVWKNGLRWAIGTGLITPILAAFGIFKFDDRRERENLLAEVAKDTGKNLVKLSKVGKFAVRIGELIADRVSGEGYNWNRNTFDLPAIDVLETGVDAIVAVSQAIADAGLTDEFVEEITRADKEFNKQLEEKILADIEKAIKSSYEFGARISQLPILAPVQEFLRPALIDSKIKIIREVTFGDVESPQEFSERVFALFEKRRELNTKSKKKRLSRREEQVLRKLNSFATKANSISDIIKETGDRKLRVLRFSLFESNLSTIENSIEFLSEK